MNYYKQGDAANADQIKAAFEKKGIDVLDFGFADKTLVYCSIGHGCVQCLPYSINFMHILCTHPDYKELELPIKPHYDISNFKPFDKVLTRNYDTDTWSADWFSYYVDDEDGKTFITTCAYRNQCIPFNEDTKHLLGTTDMPDEQYINW